MPKKRTLNKNIKWGFIAFVVFLVCISYIDIIQSNKKVEISLNDLYLKERQEHHILICSYRDYKDDQYQINCKNTFRFFKNTKVPKKFLSDKYLEEKYDIILVTRYQYSFGKNYLIGWYHIPNKETREELKKVFLGASDHLKYVEKVLDYVFRK